MPFQSGRCVNLFTPTHKIKHLGKGMRKISKNILKNYPNLNKNSWICSKCEKKLILK